MNFDLRPHVNLDPAESQQAEGLDGATLSVDVWQDVNENCTFAAAGQTMADYGYGDSLEPERWRELVTPGWHGGEGWQATADVIVAHPELFPDHPLMTIEQPADVAAAMREFGAQGFMVHFGGWCTRSAVWTAGDQNGGLSHAGRIVYADDSGIAVWNVWTGYLVVQPDDFWRAAYDGGGLLVFHRSLTGGLDMATADQILDLVTRINTEVGYDASNPNGGITPNGVAGVLISGVAAIAAQVGVEEKTLAALQAKVFGLATPTLDPVAFAAALATHPLTSHLDDAERDAVAAHVITALAGQLGKA